MASHQKHRPNSNGFFLDNLKQHVCRPNPLSKSEIYKWYHKKIAEKQAKRVKELAIVFDMIRNRVGILGVNWEDETKKLIRDECISELMGLEQDIRISFTKQDAIFLEALQNVMSHNID
jgi:hypothetical protein